MDEVSKEELIKQLDRKTRELYVINHATYQLNKTINLRETLNNILSVLNELLGIKHSMILLAENEHDRLIVFASFGYDNTGEGAEVEIGKGVIGVVAKRKKTMRMTGIRRRKIYVQSGAKTNDSSNEIDLPGLPDVESQIAMPLILNDELIGVLSIESLETSIFSKDDEDLMQTLTNQMAASIQNALLYNNLEEIVDQRTAEVTHQKEEIEAQRDELERQRDVVNEQKKNMTASITYASRIQKAMLGNIEEVEANFDNAFIFHSPHSIVSGDFYWYGSLKSPFVIDNKDDIKIIIAADCTGHGVPGAFMTVLGYSLLNEIINEERIINPAKILHRLDEKITKVTKSKNSAQSVNDGMDMSILVFDDTNHKVYFSAAKNPLYYVRNNELTQIKGSKYPIGGDVTKVTKEFELHKLDVQDGDMFYIFSDGFQDQSGGEHGRKYLTRNYREFIHSIAHLPPKEQKEKLNAEFVSWKGLHHQTDDILIIGIKA